MKNVWILIIVLGFVKCKDNSQPLAESKEPFCDSTYQIYDSTSNRQVNYCIHDSLMRRIILDMESMDTLYFEDQISDNIINKTYYRRNEIDEQIISIMVDAQYKMNFFMKYSNNSIVNDSSTYLSIDNDENAYHIQLNGIEADSLKYISGLTYFPNIFEITTSSKKIPIKHANKPFTLGKDLFNEDSIVVIIAYESIISNGTLEVRGRPFYLTQELIEWQEKNLRHTIDK